MTDPDESCLILAPLRGVPERPGESLPDCDSCVSADRVQSCPSQVTNLLRADVRFTEIVLYRQINKENDGTLRAKRTPATRGKTSRPSPVAKRSWRKAGKFPEIE